MPVRDVVILCAARTPIGRYGGSFTDLHPAELGAVDFDLVELNEAFAAEGGLATLCVSVGMGMALAIERCE